VPIKIVATSLPRLGHGADHAASPDFDGNTVDRLQLTMTTIADRVVIVLGGALTGNDAAELHRFLINFSGEVTVDMSRVTVVDAAGLGALCEAHSDERHLTLLDAPSRVEQALVRPFSTIRLERGGGTPPPDPARK
jgi:anti-anti-sigma regulatory factor